MLSTKKLRIKRKRERREIEKERENREKEREIVRKENFMREIFRQKRRRSHSLTAFGDIWRTIVRKFDYRC